MSRFWAGETRKVAGKEQTMRLLINMRSCDVDAAVSSDVLIQATSPYNLFDSHAVVELIVSKKQTLISVQHLNGHKTPSIPKSAHSIHQSHDRSYEISKRREYMKLAHLWRLKKRTVD